MIGPKKGAASKKEVSKKKKPKGAAMRTPMERVMIVGPTGKRRFAWRPWQ